jgi:acetyltransferase-like isoleucine patch superfamily enzyme
MPFLQVDSTMNKKKLRRYLQKLRYIVPTLYFNFHYLPWRQAIKLPIVLYKPHLLMCKGKVRIEPEDGRIYHGMIRMGFPMTSIYPNNGITWECKGGTVIFRGHCFLGNDSYVSFGPKTTVDIGYGFKNAAGLKMVSYHSITFHRHVGLGWGSLCMDTNFHALYDMEKKEHLPAYGPIEIGEYNWFGADCKVMHSVTTPGYCIWGMGTTITRGCVKKPYCLMGGSPVRVLRENVMRDYEHDVENNH